MPRNKQPRNEHLADREIVLAMDGELPAARQHLDECALCRERLAGFEGTIEELANTYREEMRAQVGPVAGPRALLRAQIDDAQAKKDWRVFARFGGPVAASLIAASLMLFAFYERGLLRGNMDLTPRTALTPGETRQVSVDDVCRAPMQESANVPATVRQAVFREYGIRDAGASGYEVDYLITPELGGSNSIRNLWPEPYSAVWNAHVKDELEDRLHGLVCAGQVDLSTAQREIASDWIGAWKKYFHRERPE